MRRKLTAIGLFLLLATVPISAAEECDRVAELADHWDEGAEWLANAMDYGYSQADEEEFDRQFTAAVGASLALATEMVASGDPHWTTRGNQIAEATGTVQGSYDAGAEPEVLFDAIVDLVDLLDVVVDECDAVTETVSGPAAAGSIQVVYHPAATQDQQQLAAALADIGLFQELADEAATSLALPMSLTVNFAPCDQPNAFFDPESKQIIMCYELFQEFEAYFSGVPDEEQFLSNVLGAGAFVLLHELGHALVHILELPITGREEDSVDGLATWVLLETERPEAVFGAIGWFAEKARLYESGQSQLAFWDEHSLNSQRAYDVACVIYGSNPRGYDNLVASGWLPVERAVRCQAEYDQKNRAWNEILAPYFTQ